MSHLVVESLASKKCIEKILLIFLTSVCSFLILRCPPSLQEQCLVEVTGYSLEDLMPCVEELHQTYLAAAQHAQQSVREKYKGSK